MAHDTIQPLNCVIGYLLKYIYYSNFKVNWCFAALFFGVFQKNQSLDLKKVCKYRGNIFVDPSVKRRNKKTNFGIHHQKIYMQLLCYTIPVQRHLKKVDWSKKKHWIASERMSDLLHFNKFDSRTRIRKVVIMKIWTCGHWIMDRNQYEASDEV